MTTAKTPVAAMSTEDLLPMLRVIAESTERSEPLNSRDLSRQLGWSDAVTAASLAAARERLLIWGMASRRRYRSRSVRCSPTRMALAIAVRAGFTAPMLGKKLVSTT